MRYLILLSLVTLAFDVSARKLKVEPLLKAELSAVFDATVKLHTACIKKSEEKIESSLTNLIGKIDGAKKKSALQPSIKSHLTKVLDSAKNHLELSQMRTGKKRSRSLKGAFKQIVQLEQTFRLGGYRIFFCSKDKAIWLQKSWTPKNPISPDQHLSCGKAVY